MLLERALDFAVALVGLTIASPFLLLIAVAIWLEDFHFPLYFAPRMARGEGTFSMVKFRSMTVDTPANRESTQRPATIPGSLG